MVFFLLVVFGLLSFTSSQISHQYHFINISKSWTEAQRFCREMYTDLATVNNEDEMKILLKNITDNSYDVYIGLYRGDVFRWHWTLPDSLYNEDTYQNWKNNKPDENNNVGCAAMNNGKWFSDSCDIQRQFVCFNATTNKKYILIEVKKSWREAQEYCRTVHTDLANVRTSSENKDIKDIAKENEVWIGLFKDSWLWSDQSDSSYRFWNSSQLSNSRRDWDCVTLMVNQTGKWNGVQCNTTQPFICYSDLKSQSTTKPATPRPATTNTENTSTQPTQILTTGPEQDNLILVRENLTWSEAVTYCRKHHIDLVSIHSEEHQNRAARKAIEASTSYVWLGLRYTCTFNFWFWIKNREAGCYQNWASGHGPHGFEECGLSGAMESTGGHRWVGISESERLNFICQICTNAF